MPREAGPTPFLDHSNFSNSKFATGCFEFHFFSVSQLVVLFPHAQCRPTGVYLLQTRTGVRENAIFYVQESNCGKMINCPQSKKQDSNPKRSQEHCAKRHVNGVCVCGSVCVTESHDHMNNMTCRKERSPVVTSWQRNTACVKIGSKQGINIETKVKKVR